MAYKADNTQTVLQVLVDGITSPVTADVQAVKLIDGTAGSGAPIPGDSTNGLFVNVKAVVGATTGAHSTVASSTSSSTLKAANASRQGLAIFNDSTANLFVALAATASATAFLVKMPAGAYFEIPAGYTGVVSGIWDAVNGNARVTELT